MNIPIVQGTAVPSGGFEPQQQQQQATQTHYATTGPDGIMSDYKTDNQQQPKQFRDVFWAILFIAHLLAMFAIISLNISSMDGNGDGDGDGNAGGIDDSYSGLIWLVGLTSVVAIGTGSAALGLMMRYATELVKISLIFSVVMTGVVGILALMSGQLMMGGLSLAMCLIGICYAKAVWPRIPFAAANLNTALSAVKANMGLTVVAYLMLIIALGWSILWFVGVGQALSTSNGITLFLLFLSYYWVHQVLTNTVHVTTAGTIGTWWFVPDEATSCCSTAIQDSFCRATTYSFGSICLGSLLVAIVQALRALSHATRGEEDMQMLTCIIDCILACIEDIIEYLNKWAYVYVGLYGFGYVEAGRNVIQLFEQKGWTVIISDDLCDRVLAFVSIGVGCLSGLVGLLCTIADPDLLSALGLESGFAATGFLIGFVVGFVFCSILMSVVGSAVNTVIVCFAESPAEFEVNHPQLSAEMRSAWAQAWPEIITP